MCFDKHALVLNTCKAKYITISISSKEVTTIVVGLYDRFDPLQPKLTANNI